MRSTLLAVSAAAALLSGCGLGGPDYPTFAENSYRIEGMTASPDGTASSRTVIYRDGPKMRVEAVLPNMGPATIVFDESTNAAYVLNPTGQLATTPAPAATTTPGATAPNTTAPTTRAPTTTAPAAGATMAPVAPAAAPPQVIGVAVRIDDADAPQALEGAWAALGKDNARSAGRCEVAGEDGHQWRPRAEAAGIERIACITEDGIVLRVTEAGHVLWEATSLQRGEQDAALFGLPPARQLIDPAAAAEQVGDRMQQLDSVTGAPPAPQQAPAPRG